MTRKYVSGFTGAEIDEILQNSDYLQDIHISASGTFTTSSDTAPADSSRSEVDGYWDGYLLVPVSGSAVGEMREIDSFTSSTGTFTIESTPFSTDTGLGKYFIINPEFYELVKRLTGELSSLNTSDKSNLVSAINEVDSNADDNTTNIGDLATLNTDEKGSLVGAINENEGRIETNESDILFSRGLDEDNDKTYRVRLVHVDGKPVLRTEEVV